MKTILIAWELGANFGHAFPLAAIARSLPPDGVRVVVAASDLIAARLAFDGMPATLLQAPVWPGRRHFGNQETQASYLDVLVEAGFAEPGKFAAIAAGWRSILDLVKPDIIVADHSPGLQFAALGGGVPVIAVGTGFTMPPLGYEQFPGLRPDRAPIVPESKILEQVVPVIGERLARPPRTLAELFVTDERFVFSFPELDPYRSFRREALYLPPEPLPAFTDPPVEPRLFVYLGAETPGIDAIVQTLGAIDVPAVAYLRGDAGPLAGFLRLRGVEVHDKPPNLADMLPTVSHVFSAGGAHMAHAALAAGRPHLVLPLHGETMINFRLLDGLGVALRLDLSDTSGVRTALYNFVQEHRLIAAARQWAMTVAVRPQPDGGEAVQTALIDRLGSATKHGARPVAVS